jgi:uncharacterized alpha-E superfamily protein
MLSRIAEGLFWIGRYVERADDTARILDVHLQALLEDSWIDEDLACRSLLSVMGAPAPSGTVDRRRVVELLIGDQGNQSSIVGALSAARANARGARQIVSAEMWQVLNTSWTELPRVRRHAVSIHELLAWVHERAAMVANLADATMSHDDCWQFLALGRSLERADMTARLVATRSIAGGPSWTQLMLSCGAYQAFLRTYRGAGGDQNSAEFLLLDRLFPRSLYTTLVTAESALDHLDPARGRSGVCPEARRVIGRVRTSLEYSGAAELLADLPAEMEQIQHACAQASDAVARRYFPERAAIPWMVEVAS